MNHWPKQHYPNMRRSSRSRKATLAKAASPWGKAVPNEKHLTAQEYWAVQKWLKETDAKLASYLAMNQDYLPRTGFRVYFPSDFQGPGKILP